MCTVTALPGVSLTAVPARGDRLLLRVACNRDELVGRAPALPPATWAAGARAAILPIDPVSGGTWIAATDAGLVFAVLNVNPAVPAPAGDVSRGTIIPMLLGSASVFDALERARSIEAARYSPFRLLIVDRYQIAECWPSGGEIKQRRAFLQGPVVRTSSGLGDAVVVGPRRALFRQFFREPVDPIDAQDRYHEHQWPGREAISVRMHRPDARTVSHTVVEVGERFVTLAYRAAGSRATVSILVPRRTADARDHGLAAPSARR